MSIKLLYLSSFHPTLEYDDLILFSDLGIDWFSNGLYLNPQAPTKSLRAPIAKKINNPVKILTSVNELPKLSKEFVDQFDVIFISNLIYYLTINWQLIKDKPIIFRSYDAHDASKEAILGRVVQQGVTLVRMFDWENKISYSTKTEHIIGNYVDENIYKGWTGNEEFILTFQNDFNTRLNHHDLWGNRVYPNYEAYLEIAKNIPIKFHGVNNNHPLDSGPVDWITQKNLYRAARAYFSLGTKPSPFTYNLMEAMMTGCPTLNFGKKLGTYHTSEFKDSYILPDLLEQGVNGFYSDDINELTDIAKSLLKDTGLAQSVSIKSREFALRHFSKTTQAAKWKALFTKVIGTLD